MERLRATLKSSRLLFVVGEVEWKAYWKRTAMTWWGKGGRRSQRIKEEKY